MGYIKTEEELKEPAPISAVDLASDIMEIQTGEDLDKEQCNHPSKTRIIVGEEDLYKYNALVKPLGKSKLPFRKYKLTVCEWCKKVFDMEPAVKYKNLNNKKFYYTHWTPNDFGIFAIRMRELKRKRGFQP